VQAMLPEGFPFHQFKESDNQHSIAKIILFPFIVQANRSPGTLLTRLNAEERRQHTGKYGLPLHGHGANMLQSILTIVVVRTNITPSCGMRC